MKNFISLDNLELKSSLSLKSFITTTSEINDYPIINILQEDKNIWLSEDFLPQEIVLNFSNIKLKEYPKKLTAIGVYCCNKYPTNPKIIEVLISEEKGNNFISLGHFDLSFKAGRQLIYLDDDNDIELEETLNNVNFENLIIKLIIKETFGGKHTYINNLYLYDSIDTNNINSNSNMNSHNNVNSINSNDKNNEMDNLNYEEMYMNDNNNNINNNLDNLNDAINEINDMDNKDNQNLENLNKINGNINLELNENQNQDIITDNDNDNENELKQFENINNNFSQQIDEDNTSEYRNKTMVSKPNIKKKLSNRTRETKTPKLVKKYINPDERPLTTNSFRDINTTIRQYKNKNILDNSNISNNLTNLNFNSSNKLNQLISEFKNYRETQESIMNNYEARVRFLEDKCIELKNNMKKLNATMNTIIESQYSQSQASNDYFLKECQNMVNEAIVNVISNMGRNTIPYPQPMYPNPSLAMKKFKNMNNMNSNMYFNNYPLRKNNNNFIYGQNFANKGMNYNQMNNINNNNYYENNEENEMYDNENENMMNMNNMNNKGEEYLEQEIQNNMEEGEQYNMNNNYNNNYDMNNMNDNMEYYEPNNVNNNDANNNILDSNNNINMNLNINNLAEKNNSNELYNDGLIPYDERIKTYPKKFSNLFARSTNNYRASNKVKRVVNPNNNYELNSNNNNQNIEKKVVKNKIKPKNSKSNIVKNKNIVNKKKESNIVIKMNENQENTQKYISKNSSKKNINKEDKNMVSDSKKKINNDDITNKELSSDFSIDDIQINSKVENMLKPTLEKFENYMSINNFGKSQNVYSANSFNTKKEIFGESIGDDKSMKGKANTNNKKHKKTIDENSNSKSQINQ